MKSKDFDIQTDVIFHVIATTRVTKYSYCELYSEEQRLQRRGQHQQGRPGGRSESVSVVSSVVTVVSNVRQIRPTGECQMLPKLALKVLCMVPVNETSDSVEDNFVAVVYRFANAVDDCER